MARRSVRLLVLTLVLGAGLVVAAGPALAHGGDRGAGRQALIQAAATYLGVTKADIAAAKESGQTLAQLATAKGKSVQGLTDALVAAGKTSINQALAAGTITSAQATAKIAALPARVQALINSTGGGGSCGSHGSSSSGSSAFRTRRH